MEHRRAVRSEIFEESDPFDGRCGRLLRRAVAALHLCGRLVSGIVPGMGNRCLNRLCRLFFCLRICRRPRFGLERFSFRQEGSVEIEIGFRNRFVFVLDQIGQDIDLFQGRFAEGDFRNPGYTQQKEDDKNGDQKAPTRIILFSIHRREGSKPVAKLIKIIRTALYDFPFSFGPIRRKSKKRPEKAAFGCLRAVFAFRLLSALFFPSE